MFQDQDRNGTQRSATNGVGYTEYRRIELRHSEPPVIGTVNNVKSTVKRVLLYKSLTHKNEQNKTLSVNSSTQQDPQAV